jgi:hypothetical protein
MPAKQPAQVGRRHEHSPGGPGHLHGILAQNSEEQNNNCPELTVAMLVRGAGVPGSDMQLHWPFVP